MDLDQHKAPAIRASDAERDDALVILHNAFAEGRLTDEELDERMEFALAARTRPELDRLVADLPGRGPAAVEPAGPAEVVGRFQLAYKNSVRRGGHWRLPERYTTVIYKGSCTLDLCSAELTGVVTTIRAVAYKSTIEIIVPPGVRVEAGGFGVSSEVYGSPGGRVIHVEGFAYKGSIDVIDAAGGREIH